MKHLRTFFVLALLAPAVQGQVSLISTGAVWKYLHNGADEGTFWRTSSFSDALWPVGIGQFGWGEGDESTLLIDGPGTDEAPITIYFRKTFVVTNSIYTVTLRLLHDDGVVVYLNGREVLRNNMPAGVVTFQTFASEPVQTDENRYVQYGFFSDVLRQGTNLIAVEIHQAPNSAGWEDCSFDLELTANHPQGSPQVIITAPPNGATVHGEFVSVAVEAGDEDGHVALVQYFLNHQLAESSTQAPSFEATVLAGVGRHLLRAVAYDNFGYYKTSPPSFFQIGGEWPVNLLRGPYLQSGSPTGMMVRWRTDWPTNSLVRFGTNIANLDAVIDLPHRTNEHQVPIGGLSPDTTYYYQIGMASQTLYGGVIFTFRTSPTNTRPVRVWVIGDAGTAQPEQETVRDVYFDHPDGGVANTDLWLMLGDNAYELGTDDEYQQAVFNMYGDLLSRVPVWPTIGNHDTETRGVSGQFPYLDMFTLPTQGESGGIPSGTEKYYSFDYANIHFICLDSQSSDRSPQGPMLTWLREDLGATDKDWIVAFFHHPPYSFGSHHSDQDLHLAQIRERVLPVLEAHGVDLVLAGHSHVYERSFLLNGHYGYSSTLTPEMVVDSSLGRDDVAPYRKPAGGLGANRGTVYAVCGCSGQGGYPQFALHPAMATNSGGFGSMILDFDNQKLHARFLRSDGTVFDTFTIDKSQATSVRPHLHVARSPGGAAISWPTSNPSYALEAAPIPSTNATWQPSTNGITRVGRRQVVNVGLDSTNRFFRLRSP